MKIEKIETEIVDVKFFPDRSRQQLLVRITTDEGLTGIGEAWSGGPPGPVKAAVTDLLTPLIMGEDSARIETFGTRCTGGPIFTAPKVWLSAPSVPLTSPSGTFWANAWGHQWQSCWGAG